MLAAASDKRAKAVADHWRGQVEPTLDMCMNICQRLAQRLDQSTLDVLDTDATTMIQRLTSAVERLAAIQGGNTGSAPRVIFNFNLTGQPADSPAPLTLVSRAEDD